MTPDQLLAGLDYAASRLTLQIMSSRGPVLDDDKVWAMEFERDCIREARRLLAIRKTS